MFNYCNSRFSSIFIMLITDTSQGIGPMRVICVVTKKNVIRFILFYFNKHVVVSSYNNHRVIFLSRKLSQLIYNDADHSRLFEQSRMFFKFGKHFIFVFKSFHCGHIRFIRKIWTNWPYMLQMIICENGKSIFAPKKKLKKFPNKKKLKK